MPISLCPRHPRFWHSDGNLLIQVENTQYKLHRYLFNKAKNFPALWVSSAGNSFDNPFYMSESKTDFDRFLSVLYPTDYSEHECRTTEEWTSVLSLANQWGMESVRRLAVKHLAACAGPVDKIALGHRYNIPEWLAPAYLALAMRREAITGAEGAKMGVEALVRIGALKDEVFANLTEYVDQEKFSQLFASKMAI
ncbi:hypothetical protein B0H15DRAFT_771524 [Mycena belliarum]|uniref:BTB domain-containing protein n=1 Tax=Mycena belliarum TaxID=1033014 RepID=A0AAD6UE93_9AGAR|nr:hypothetical protein B0H15DRAFT_771524 [Mycena belliae]